MRSFAPTSATAATRRRQKTLWRLCLSATSADFFLRRRVCDGVIRRGKSVSRRLGETRFKRVREQGNKVSLVVLGDTYRQRGKHFFVFLGVKEVGCAVTESVTATIANLRLGTAFFGIRRRPPTPACRRRPKERTKCMPSRHA